MKKNVYAATVLLILIVSLFLLKRRETASGLVKKTAGPVKRSLKSQRLSYFEPQIKAPNSPEKIKGCEGLAKSLLELDLTQYGSVSDKTESWSELFTILEPKKLIHDLAARIAESGCPRDDERDPRQPFSFIEECRAERENCLVAMILYRRRQNFLNYRHVPLQELNAIGPLIDRMIGLLDNLDDNYPAIIDTASKVLDLWPENEMAASFRANALYKKLSAAKSPEEAERLRADFEESIEFLQSYHPESPELQTLVAENLIYQKKWRELETAALATLETAPSPYQQSIALYYLAEKAWQQKDLATTRSYLKAGLKLDPTSYLLQNTLQAMDQKAAGAGVSPFFPLAGQFVRTEPIQWNSEELGR